MVADPPYGVGYDPSWRARRNLSSDRLAQGKVLNDDRASAAAMSSIAAWRRLMRRSRVRCWCSEGRKCYGANLLVEDEGALAGRVGGGRPGPERRCRV
jgi:hypothetical protein